MAHKTPPPIFNGARKRFGVIASRHGPSCRKLGRTWWRCARRGPAVVRSGGGAYSTEVAPGRLRGAKSLPPEKPCVVSFADMDLSHGTRITQGPLEGCGEPEDRCGARSTLGPLEREMGAANPRTAQGMRRTRGPLKGCGEPEDRCGAPLVVFSMATRCSSTVLSRWDTVRGACCAHYH